MLSLVLKDVVAARWFLIAAFPLYAIQLVTMASTPPALILVTLLFTSVFAFGSIALEEIQGTEILWCSLPVERSTIVFARYLTVVMVTLGGLGMSWVLGYAGARWLPLSGDGAETVRLGPLPYSLMLLMILGAAAIYLPCYFRLGAGRGLILACLLGLALLVLATAVGSLIVYWTGGADALRATQAPSPDAIARVRSWLDRWDGFLAAALSIVALLVAAASAALAARFYSRRDC
jgi:ABC-type transport system involved in multi-copper enzyme maturation permease subunit